MVSWVLLASLAPAFLALVNVLDKFMLEKRIKDCFALAIGAGCFALLASIITYVLFPLADLTRQQVLFGIAIGLLAGVSYLLYFYVVVFEEISRVISVYYLTPIFVLLFALFILHESLPMWKYGAILAACLGAVLVGIHVRQKKYRTRKGFWLMILACVFSAGSALIQKYLLATVSYWNVFTLQAFGIGLSLLTAVYSRRARAHLPRVVRNVHLVFASEGLSHISFLLFLAAVAQAEVSKVSAMGSLQPLYVLVLMLLLSRFKPHILKEVFTKKTLALKAVAVLMIVVGTFFVAL